MTTRTSTPGSPRQDRPERARLTPAERFGEAMAERLREEARVRSPRR